MRLLLVALFLLASTAARAQQMTIYDWSAAINLGLGVLHQMMSIHRQLQQNNGSGYGSPYGGHGFGAPGWHLRGRQQGWNYPPAWGQSCRPQLMQNQMGQHAIVDPCTGNVLQWVR